MCFRKGITSSFVVSGKLFNRYPFNVNVSNSLIGDLCVEKYRKENIGLLIFITLYRI